MTMSKDEAIHSARQDLAKRLGIKDSDIGKETIEEADFPDMALGAAAKGEMSGQMITSGWRIRLPAKGQNFEYRANKNQLRLYNYKGENYRI